MYAGEKTVFDVCNTTTLYRFPYLPWPPWVVQHRLDHFYFLLHAQGGQEKYMVFLLCVAVTDIFATKLHQCT
jgi:hypothetical protein